MKLFLANESRRTAGPVRLMRPPRALELRSRNWSDGSWLRALAGADVKAFDAKLRY